MTFDKNFRIFSKILPFLNGINFVEKYILSRMGLLAGIYSGLFKRTSTFALCIGVGVIGVSCHL